MWQRARGCPCSRLRRALSSCDNKTTSGVGMTAAHTRRSRSAHMLSLFHSSSACCCRDPFPCLASRRRQPTACCGLQDGRHAAFIRVRRCRAKGPPHDQPLVCPGLCLPSPLFQQADDGLPSSSIMAHCASVVPSSDAPLPHLDSDRS
jgi:hypothetical protein